MSPKAVKHPATKPSDKHAVPIVNVFDEEGTDAPVQPARRPVVVEIEDVPPASAYQEQGTTEKVVPPIAPTYVPPTQDYPQVPTPPQVDIQSPLTQGIPSASTSMPAPSTIQTADFQSRTPSAPAMQPQEPSRIPMSKEPVLPSFFAQDLQQGVPAPTQAAPVSGGQAPFVAPPTTIQPAVAMMESAVPQAVVGEINEISDEGNGSNKKLIGIILMVLAVVLLLVAGFFLYARNLFSPVSLPTPTPAPIQTPRPTIPPTPTPQASESAKLSTESAQLKKKVKVDVLNGTKIAGLAAKQAAILKTAGYTMGTVGNGKPENAGTIVVAPAYRVLADDIVKLLKEFTFKIEENAKSTTIQVTLGE